MTTGLLLSQAIKLFLIARQADSYSPSTVAQYKWALDKFVALGDKKLKDVTTDDIRLFLSYLQTDYKSKRSNTEKLGSTSLFHAWKAVRAFYKWICPEFGLPNPSAKLPQPRYMSAVIVPFKQEEVKALIKACDRTAPSKKSEARKTFAMKRPTSTRDHAIVLVLLDTGLRVSELCRLMMSDCDLQSGSLVVRPFGAGMKSRSRVVPLGGAARKALALYVIGREGTRDEPLFQLEKGGEMNKGNVLHLLYALGERAGIHNVHPHRFRHTFAIQYLRNGGDLFTLQRLLGHTSLEMTRRYLDLAQIDDEKAHKKASPVDNWRL